MLWMLTVIWFHHTLLHSDMLALSLSLWLSLEVKHDGLHSFGLFLDSWVAWLWKFFSIQDRWFGSGFGCCFSFHFLLVSSILHNLLDSKVAVRCLLLSPFSNRWKPWSFIRPQNENTCVCLFNMYLMLHFTNRPTDLGGKETKTVEAGGSSSAFTVVEFKVTLSIWSTVEVFLVGHS